MFKSLEIFKTAHAMAQHAGARQAVVAQNIANADTPGYQALDLTPFEEAYRSDGGPGQMRATRAGHYGQAMEAAPLSPHKVTSDISPNGNSVSLEEEMMKGVEVKRDHDRALAIYKSSLSVLRTALGR